MLTVRSINKIQIKHDANVFSRSVNES